MAAGFLKRVRRLTLGRIEAFLDSAEDPDDVFPRLVDEMRDECRKAIDAEATAAAALKRREMEHAETKTLAEKWTRRAELAVQNRDYGLARTAIENQMPAERLLALREDDLAAARTAAERARTARIDLHRRLRILESRRDEIIARARAAEANADTQRALAGVQAGSGGRLLDIVRRLEEKVVVAEARAEAYGDVAAGTLADAEAKFRELEHRRAIDERLAELRQKVEGPAEPEVAPLAETE